MFKKKKNAGSGSSRKKIAMRRKYNQFLKLVRRTHMYTGLLLLPWVLLFGLSGLFFNHPNWATPTDTVHVAQASVVQQTIGFTPIDSQQLAEQVIAFLNQAGDEKFAMVNGSSRITGRLTINAASEHANHTARVNLVTGKAEIQTTPQDQQEKDEPDFAGQRVTDLTIDTDLISDGAEALFETAGITIDQRPRMRLRPAPELQFQLTDEAGKVWNTTFNLANGQLAGRAAQSPSGLGFRDSLTRLHRLHQYPDAVGARWFWTFLADATALTMVFWGISGALMWWQIKPTRLLGVGAVSVAVVIAWLIIAGTLAELTFGPTSSRRGGGGGGGHGQRAAVDGEKATRSGQRGGRPMRLTTEEASDIEARMRRRRANQRSSDRGESDTVED